MFRSLRAMARPSDLVLTAAQMRAAEAALIADGVSVEELMQRAGRGAAEWVWRLSGGRSVTVLCGPGNNGGDGWVIAEALRAKGGDVTVVMAAEPATDAAKDARKRYGGEVLGASAVRHGEVFVDCLFGTGLTRPLSDDHAQLLSRLAASHHKRLAIDLPSGIDTDLGQPLGSALPNYDLTVALGAWKPAHFLMPAAATMGALRLVDIGIGPVEGAALAITQPQFSAPAPAAHKYTRGLLGIVAGAMPGAALLAAQAAQGAGAGYVKLFGAVPGEAPADLVWDDQPLAEALTDKRISALLIGPGLGRDGAAREALAIALSERRPTVLDADALVLLAPRSLADHSAPLIATPHEGELSSLERAFDLDNSGGKVARALALAQAANMVVVAKGPDTVVAAPDGRLAYAPRGSSWLSTAGTGDVLAGTIASRLANGADPFDAACQGVWLHGEAARLCGPAFSAGHLAEAVRAAYAACL
jgi:ADP-dependent NAD(P)H-hydrate dehydratase / NAD(P)H-hydrate epimerase